MYQCTLNSALQLDYVQYSSKGSDFYIGVLVQHNSSHLPSILVTTEETDGVNFTVFARDPPFERNATVYRGNVVSIQLPAPSMLSSSPDIEGVMMGVRVLTETNQFLSVALLHDISAISPAYPCLTSNNRLDRSEYSYHLFPAALSEQPSTRSVLLLVGCQDATSIQIFSTHELSLPVDLNANVEHTPSRATIVTSFSINKLDSVAISVNDDPSSVHIVSDNSLTVTLVSMALCLEMTPTGYRSTVCSSSYTQLPPWFTWGRYYFVGSRPGGMDSAQYLIQSGISNSSSVMILCNNSTHTDAVSYSRELTISSNGIFLLQVTSKHYCSIESKEQIQVIQYGPTETRGRNTIFPLLIPPIEQYSNDFILPLLPHNQTITPEDSLSFNLYATVFISAANDGEIEREGNRLIVDGEVVMTDGTSHAIFCGQSKICGYQINIDLPLQSSINISHENPEVSFSVLVHRVGVAPFSYSAGFRLNDLSGKPCNESVCRKLLTIKVYCSVSIVSIVYLEKTSYVVVEEDLQVEVVVVRNGDYSKEVNILFTTSDNTAIGNV